MKTILFVCTGNICRSPMAEGLFRRMTKDRGGYEVLSAGVGAMDGLPPSQHAIRAMQDLGIDISRQRSRALTSSLVSQADYIFGMTQGHVDAITMLYPQTTEKTFVLREFDETLDTYEKDISDPIGESFTVYVECRDQIEQGLVSMLKFIEQNSSDSKPTPPDDRIATVALGADHAGYALKEFLKEHLRTKGIEVTDCGAFSAESCDYPDYAPLGGREGRGGSDHGWPAGLRHRRGHEHRRQQGYRHSRRSRKR